MEKLLLWVGRLAGLAGVLVVLAAVLARGSGSYIVSGMQVGTLLQVGIATMVVACLAYLAYLAERPRPLKRAPPPGARATAGPPRGGEVIPRRGVAVPSTR